MIVKTKPLTVIAGGMFHLLYPYPWGSGTSVSGLPYLVMQISHADHTILYGIV